MFGNVLFQFILVAFAVFFFVVKPLNKLTKKEEAKPSAPPKQEVLLTEIRDLLKKK
jgi:large conductance mechanosensitive channel